MNKIRIGHGYDVHKFAAGRKLILGGVTVDYELGLDGHSDADVICHAIMDSLLGAAALGDIGSHFGNTDPSFKDADSIMLLRQVNGFIAKAGFKIGNLDVSVIAEKPRLAPYMNQMRQRISDAIELPVESISIKATTNENIGWIGQGEGIAAFSVALLYK
jgi:2-C-methyl-D-erythritol 2,4-cyclodiphosphate synthase